MNCKAILFLLPVIAAAAAFGLDGEAPGAKLGFSCGDVINCDGGYKDHVQGLDTDGTNLYWSFASTLVKTDRRGRVLKAVPVDYHCGDPCWAEGRLYVPYGGGSWNREIGDAESKNYIRVYDSELNFVRQYHVPELVYGAGCIAWHDGKFFVAGGLPDGRKDNPVYEYDRDFRMLSRHTVEAKSLLGIQTIKFADGSWWLGCYGKSENFCVRTDADFRIQKIYPYATTVGIVPLGTAGNDPLFLVAWHIFDSGKHLNRASAVVLKATPEAFVRKP